MTNCSCGRILYEVVNYCPSCGERQENWVGAEEVKKCIEEIKKSFISNGEKISIEEVYDDLGHPDTWDWRHEPTEEDEARVHDALMACSCGCSACQGTGHYRMGRSYKECCHKCPIHHGG